MKNKKSLFVIIGLIAILIVGGTLAAYFTSDYYPGTFGTKPYNTSVTDLFVSPSNWVPGQTTAKRVFATNESDTDVAVRISISDKWISANGDEIPKYQNGILTVSIHFVNELDWIEDKKYYYYNKFLKKNESTSDFIDSITFNRNVEIDDECTNSEDGLTITCISSGNGYDNAQYQITFNIEMVQADAYKEIWNTDYEIGSKVDCTDYFVKHLLKMANEDVGTSYLNSNINQMYAFNHGTTDNMEQTTEYRYIGNEPNNYVYFNCSDFNDKNTCEVWRIIGVFNVEDEDEQFRRKVKLVSPYVYNYNFGMSSFRNWQNSSIRNSLNEGTYWNTLTSETKERISTSKYYLSTKNYTYSNGFDGNAWYTLERSITLNDYPTNFFDKIAVMYPSDYIYTFANNVSSSCYSNGYRCDNSETSNSWIFNSDTLKDGSEKKTNFLLVSFANNDAPFFIDIYGNLNYGTSYSTYMTRPVLYLDPALVWKSGDGSLESPYEINYKTFSIIIDNELFNIPSIGVAGHSIPIDDTGKYQINSFKLNGKVVNGNSFTMPGEDVNITDVEYYQIYFNITSDDENLTVANGAFIGDKITVGAISEDYSIESFKLNGERINGNTFIMPEEDVVISDVVYRSSIFNITNSDEDITVPENARKGTTVTLLSDNYGIVSFKLNGETITGNTFIMPEEDVVISDIEKVECYVAESEHNPYSNNINNVVYFERTFEGANSITVELTYQTESINYDWIYLYKDSSTIYGDRYGNPTKNTATITIPSNYLKIVFRTDVSVNDYYGFKAVITPNY